MPRGPLGPTTLLHLPPQEIQSVERWHRKEWEQFRQELVAFKERVHTKALDFIRFNRDHCIACKGFKGWRKQRGSILLSAFGISPGSGDCTFTASTIPNLTDFTFEPDDAWTRARLHSDGDWYSHQGSNSWSTSDGTWQGICTVAEYDTRWTRVSGSTPNSVTSGTDGVWSAATTSKAVGYQVTFGIRSGSFTLECRDGTSLNVLFTDSFTMFGEVDSKN